MQKMVNLSHENTLRLSHIPGTTILKGQGACEKVVNLDLHSENDTHNEIHIDIQGRYI
jgi:hypothetical protein